MFREETITRKCVITLRGVQSSRHVINAEAEKSYVP